MPMSFPDMNSLTGRATMRGFRQPDINESEEDYRESFSDFMKPIDLLESMEILSGETLSSNPLALAAILMGWKPAKKMPPPVVIEPIRFKHVTKTFGLVLANYTINSLSVDDLDVLVTELNLTKNDDGYSNGKYKLHIGDSLMSLSFPIDDDSNVIDVLTKLNYKVGDDNTIPSIFISLSRYKVFKTLFSTKKYKNYRLGQAFHNFMELSKITSHNKIWCDMLYHVSDDVAKVMIEAQLDLTN